jgi:hypothetical protein
MNSTRPADQKISLSSKETARGYPIDKPTEYNPTLIQGQFSDLKKILPPEIAHVVLEGAAFTPNPPLPLKDYIYWGDQVDRVYQIASRWRTMQPYLYYLEQRRSEDIRGYYFLSRMKDRAAKLANYAGLADQEKSDIRGWLIGLCINNGGPAATCTREVDAKIAGKNDLEAYYQQNQANAAETYNSYFRIPSSAPRPEFREEALAKGSRFLAPFQDPGTDEVRHFLQDNIQDEWKFGDWHLELPFQNNSELAHVEFEPDATPHVNGLGGDTITMNANQPLTEYDAQWTIRHEYGHVLGFPDCYVEFYVRERNVIINYQLDTANIMCSRLGHVKAENVSELRRAYAH